MNSDKILDAVVNEDGILFGMDFPTESNDINSLCSEVLRIPADVKLDLDNFSMALSNIARLSSYTTVEYSQDVVKLLTIAHISGNLNIFALLDALMYDKNGLKEDILRYMSTFTGLGEMKCNCPRMMWNFHLNEMI